ncbi:MAG: hypothetical protein U0Q16_35420 [Bryobacteraceae bacterium]
MNFVPFVATWAALAVVVLALAAYRQFVSYNEDDSVHLADKEGALVQQQATLAARLGWIDRWGKMLTAFEVVFGLVLASVYLYQVYLTSTRMPTL